MIYGTSVTPGVMSLMKVTLLTERAAKWIMTLVGQGQSDAEVTSACYGSSFYLWVR
jgi:hypothetical protein